MSVNVHIYGVRDPDGKLGDMIQLMEQCDKLEIPYPDKLKEYFKGTEALDMGTSDLAIKAATEVSLGKWGLNIEGLVDGDVEYGDGMIVDLSKLPEDIKRLRISMS